MNNLEKLGVAVPEILIPNEKINMRKWSVIACDQYTSNPQYWNEVERIVGSSPSALHIMLPEIYLNAPDVQQRIAGSKEVMRSYLDDSVLNLLPPGFILVERFINGIPRKGLMVNVDLECYDYDPYEKPIVRASEQTLMERIPPRVEIRREADVEMPHVFLLMDDKENTVIEPAWQKRTSFPKLYDFELMQGGGRVVGYFIDNKEVEQQILDAMAALPTHDGMRFCVGDGNHSLATAKAVWEEAKQTMTVEEQAESPLRYALAELVNLYDNAMAMRPIHRVVEGVNASKCIQYVVDQLNARGAEAKLIFSRRKPSMQETSAAQVIFFTSKDSAGRIEIGRPVSPLIVGEIQPVLEKFVRENPSSRLEYVHGDEELEELSKQYDTLGFIMQTMDKEEFFDRIIECGVLPKKCFSLGEANEKRYYLECRLLTDAEEAVEEEPEEETAEDEFALEDELPEDGEYVEEEQAKSTEEEERIEK